MNYLAPLLSMDDHSIRTYLSTRGYEVLQSDRMTIHRPLRKDVFEVETAALICIYSMLRSQRCWRLKVSATCYNQSDTSRPHSPYLWTDLSARTPHPLRRQKLYTYKTSYNGAMKFHDSSHLVIQHPRTYLYREQSWYTYIGRRRLCYYRQLQHQQQ